MMERAGVWKPQSSDLDYAPGPAAGKRPLRDNKSTHPSSPEATIAPRNTRPSLRRNFFWAALGNGVQLTCRWGVIACLAKLGSTQMLGQFVAGIALTMPIIVFAAMNAHVAVATDARGQFRFGEYLALWLITNALALAAAAALALAIGYRGEQFLVIVGLGISKALEMLSLLCHGWFQKHERMVPVARSQAIYGPSVLLVVATIVAATGHLGWAVLGMIVVGLLVLLGHDIPCVLALAGKFGERLWPQLRAGRLLTLLWLVLPMGIAIGIDCLNVNLPRYFVEHCLGHSVLGIFAAIAYLGMAGRMFYPPLIRAVIPRLSQHYAQGKLLSYLQLVCKLLAISVAVGAAIVGVVALVGRQLLAVLYTTEYAAYSTLFTWMALAVAVRFQVIVLVASLQATRHFKTITPVSLVSCAVLTVLLAVWVPRFGLLGAAWAILVNSLVELLLYCALNMVVIGWGFRRHSRHQRPLPSREAASLCGDVEMVVSGEPGLLSTVNRTRGHPIAAPHFDRNIAAKTNRAGS